MRWSAEPTQQKMSLLSTVCEQQLILLFQVMYHLKKANSNGGVYLYHASFIYSHSFV